jgi:hypothetical protein
MDKKAGKHFAEKVDVIFCSAKVAKITAAKRKFCFDLVTSKRSFLISADTVRFGVWCGRVCVCVCACVRVVFHVH